MFFHKPMVLKIYPPHINDTVMYGQWKTDCGNHLQQVYENSWKFKNLDPWTKFDVRSAKLTGDMIVLNKCEVLYSV